MIFSVVNFLRGYLTVSVKGDFIERFINLAIKNNIYLWNIKITGKNIAEMRVSVRGFLRIRPVAFKTGVMVRIKKRHGVLLFMHRHRRRKAFYIGFVIFAALILYLTSFIWSVEIIGNEITDTEEIKEGLKGCGIYTGVTKYGHSSHKIKDEMLKKVPALSWIWVDIKGTRAIVTVKERTEKPQIFDKNEPCNIVAKRDAVIESTTVREGITVVKKGDIVKKGDLLVSGVADTKYSGIRLMNADAEIYAVTWYEKTKVFPLYKSVIEKTGKKQRKFVLNIWGCEFKLLPFRKIKYESYEEDLNEKRLRLWGDLYLPVTVKSGYVNETAEKKTSLSESEGAKYFGKILEDEIKKELPRECSILESEIRHSMEMGKIKISVTLKCLEDIARKTAIEVEDKFDRENF